MEKSRLNKIIGFLVILILVLGLAFATGAISLGLSHKSPVTIIYPNLTDSSASQFEAAVLNNGISNGIRENSESGKSNFTKTTSEIVVASKKGKKYHLPWCPGAKTISPENKIIFSNPKEAEKAGYTPALNCKGLKLAKPEAKTETR